MNARAATHRMMNSFSLPGAGVATDNKIAAIYRSGGDTDPLDPLVPVVTVPAGQNVVSPATAALVARVLDAARVSLVVHKVTSTRPAPGPVQQEKGDQRCASR